ncbi:MAG: hypothetical protein Q8S11_09620 [Daejeonella sp.]|uniref:hypothetical protein n=1 Tax=Daejeonella sp. TaxID=2805397 RepID=UPI00273389F3|nr:hypothetical protein [Daejeonella sp.]MDP3468579.1 hypothetical protein [Daejeonella sp.]
MPTLSIAATRVSTTTGGNWNSTSTWVGGLIPLAGDDVIIATAGTAAVTVDGLNSCFNLTIGSGGRLIIMGLNTLNVFGTVNIQRPGSGSISELNVNAGTLNVKGLFSMAASRGTRQASLNITSGTANLSDINTRGAASRIIFNGNGVLNLSGDLSGSNPALEAGQGSVNFTGTSPQNVWAKTYHNLGITGSGIKTLAGNTIVTGKASVDGELNLNKHNLILKANGNPLIAGGALTNYSGTVVYAGENDQTIAAIPYFNLSFTGTGTKKFLAGSSVLVTQDWNVDSPTLLEADACIAVNRDMTGAGILEMESGTLTIGGSNLRTGLFIPGSGTVHYSRGETQTIRAVEYYNLVLSEAGEKSIPNGEEIIINNDLEVSSPFIVPGTATVDIKGNLLGNGDITLEEGVISLAGDWLNDGNINSGNSTILYNGSGDQIIAGNEYYNLETAEGGTKSLSDDVVVKNVLSIGADTELYLDSYELTLSGSGKPLLNNGTFSPASSTVNYTNPGETEIAAVNYHDLDASGGPRKLSESGIIGISGTFSPGSGEYKIINSTVSFNGVNQTIPPFRFYHVELTGGGNKMIDSVVNVKTLKLKNGSKLEVDYDNGAKIVVIE